MTFNFKLLLFNFQKKGKKSSVVTKIETKPLTVTNNILITKEKENEKVSQKQETEDQCSTAEQSGSRDISEISTDNDDPCIIETTEGPAKVKLVDLKQNNITFTINIFII